MGGGRKDGEQDEIVKRSDRYQLAIPLAATRAGMSGRDT